LRRHFKESGSVLHFALCDLDEAEIYLQLNMAAEAAAMARNASEQFRSIGMVYEEAKALAFLGVAFMQMLHFAEALEAFLVAQRAFSDEGNDYWVAVLDLYRADVHLELRNYSEAHSLAAQAEERFERLGIPSRTMLCLVLLGRISLRVNDVVTAERYAQKISSVIEQTHMPVLRFPYYMLVGQISERKGDLVRAEEAYRLAAEDLEAHESRLQHDDLKVTFLRGRNQVYEALVRLSLDNVTSPIETAYSWCERAKSRGLVELLSTICLRFRRTRNNHSCTTFKTFAKS
jgi:tetratricopeptide (TPR) repeat protein